MFSIRDDKTKNAGSGTKTIHADDFLNSSTDVAPPLHVSTTFRYNDDPSKLVPAREQDEENLDYHIYSRDTAPNSTRFEAVLSSHLGGYAISYSSGLAAFHALLIHLNPKRLAIGVGYHGVQAVADIHTRTTGMKQLPLDCDASELEAGDVVHIETPINPYGEACNIAMYAEKAHSRGAILTIDATFAPPPLQSPFDWGADIIIHSATKYIGGHSDMLGGVLTTKDVKRRWALWKDRNALGNVMGNFEAWLGLRSMRTLELRVMRQSENATKLVQWLHEIIQDGPLKNPIANILDTVRHASLQNEPWLKEQMPNGFGPTFTIELKTELQAKTFPSYLDYFSHATSLGGVESLIEWRSMSDARVSTRLLRVSVGCENYEDLKQDLEQALLKTLDSSKQ